MKTSKETKFFMKSFYRKEDTDFVPNVIDFENDIQWLVDNNKFTQLFQEITRAMKLYKKQEEKNA